MKWALFFSIPPPFGKAIWKSSSWVRSLKNHRYFNVIMPWEGFGRGEYWESLGMAEPQRMVRSNGELCVAPPDVCSLTSWELTKVFHRGRSDWSRDSCRYRRSQWMRKVMFKLEHHIYKDVNGCQWVAEKQLSPYPVTTQYPKGECKMDWAC